VSRYLPDTTPMTGFLLGRPNAVALVDPWLADSAVATSILVYGEVVEYLMARSDFARRHAHLRLLLNQVFPLPLTLSILDRYAALRRSLRPPHGPGIIGDVDTLIAVTALERGLTMVTTDGDYLRVPNLTVTLLDRKTLAVVSERVP
jgi:predicted nucleic acid-binding protein